MGLLPTSGSCAEKGDNACEGQGTQPGTRQVSLLLLSYLSRLANKGINLLLNINCWTQESQPPPSKNQLGGEMERECHGRGPADQEL